MSEKYAVYSDYNDEFIDDFNTLEEAKDVAEFYNDEFFPMEHYVKFPNGKSYYVEEL